MAEIVQGEEDSRRSGILNAAIAAFARGYKTVSTDEIVRAAGVSKGLLFHYFGTKKDLYLRAYEYAAQAVISELFGLVNLEERDILNRWRQIALLKLDLLQKHPRILQFLSRLPDSPEVSEGVTELQGRLSEGLSPKLFENVDRSLFREDIDADDAIRVIAYTIESYAQDQFDPGKSAEEYYAEYDRYLSDLDRFVRLFRICFYRQGGNEHGGH